MLVLFGWVVMGRGELGKGELGRRELEGRELGRRVGDLIWFRWLWRGLGGNLGWYGREIVRWLDFKCFGIESEMRGGGIVWVCDD